MTPTAIIIHCSATRETQSVSVEQINEMHRRRAFSRLIPFEGLRHIGYHYYIRRDGSVHPGRLEFEQGAHCLGWNNRSLGVCYEGGLDAAGKPKDTRTAEQKGAMLNLLRVLVRQYNIRDIFGHRDTSPDLNGNGTLEEAEWIKSCPCFDAKEEYKHLLINKL